MPTATRTKTLNVNIPFFGECTLLPADILPDELRTYEKILATAKELDMEEFKDLSRREVQEIFKALAFKLLERGVKTGECVSVILSGSHDSYSRILFTVKDQKTEKSVTSIQFFFWEDTSLSPEGKPIGGPADMQLDEIPIDEKIFMSKGDSTYCLFLGT
ncbi:MAG: hypothetical protein WCT07_02480 [Candidatus Paceibacterota bacterium]|jgi:hypothetical protein